MTYAAVAENISIRLAEVNTDRMIEKMKVMIIMTPMRKAIVEQ